MKFFSLFIFCFLLISPRVMAVDDFVSEDEENNITGTSSSGFIIDSADSGNDLQLQFGDTLNESLQWNSTLNDFVLSDTLRVGGNLDLTENQLTFDVDNIGVGSDVRIIANQGSDNKGEIRYNSADNQWEIQNDGGSFMSLVGGGSLAPYIHKITGTRLEPSTSGTLNVLGGNFDPSTIVTIPGWLGTIDDIRYISDEKIEVDVTAGNVETLYSVVLANGGFDSTGYEVDNGLNVLTVQNLPDWLDLRLGGATLTHGNGAGNDIRYRSGMSLSRDANGMSFSGSTPWSSWAKFEVLPWSRGSDRVVEWIFNRPTGAMMIGVGSTATNETNTAQYTQAEILTYFSNSTTMWGLYGNNGTIGGTGNQSSNQSIAGGTGVYKIKFEEDGELGETFTLYELPTANPSDWNDESVVLTTFVIGGTLNPDEPDLMPMVIPLNGGTQRMIAVRIQ